jgi:hypothetical protein
VPFAIPVTLTHGETSGFPVSTGVTASVSPGANKLIKIWISTFGSAATPTNVAGNGITYTHVLSTADYNNGFGPTAFHLFRGMAAAPTPGVITITGASGTSYINWTVEETGDVDTTGVNGAGAIVQAVAQENGAPTNSIGLTMAAFADAANGVICGIHTYNSAARVEGSGFALGFDGSGTGRPSTEYRFDNDTSPDWTFSPDTRAGAIAIEIKPGSGPPPAPPLEAHDRTGRPTPRPGRGPYSLGRYFVRTQLDAYPSAEFQSTGVAQASETNLAHPLAAAQANQSAQASEANSAQPMASAQARQVAQASEVNSAQPLASAQARQIAQASESDQAQAVAARQVRTLGQATEDDAAQALTASLPGSITAASEANAAQPMQTAQARALGQAAETDEALPCTVGGFIGSVGIAAEVDAAQALALSFTGIIGQAAEANEALPMVQEGPPGSELDPYLPGGAIWGEPDWRTEEILRSEIRRSNARLVAQVITALAAAGVLN